MTAAELLETALIESHRRGMTDCQILILLALARRARPLRICELSSEVRRHRQTVLRAAECFTESQLIDHPKWNQTCVYGNLVSNYCVKF